MKSATRAKRHLCLWFPDWPIQRRVAATPELAESVLLLTESNGRGIFVRHANSAAYRRGIRVGMPLAEARSFADSRERIVVEGLQPGHEAAALGEAARQCEPYSFCIGPGEEDRPESLLMDVTGVAHLFGGEEALAEALERHWSERGFSTRIAVAATIGAAWAAAHCLARRRRPHVVPLERLTLPEAIPVEGLRLSQKDVDALHRLGIRTIRQLRQLDRKSLPSRLGTDVLLRLDQLTGERAEFITPYRPQQRFRTERFLEKGILQPQAVEAFWSGLLKQLLNRLRAEQLVMGRLQCELVAEESLTEKVTINFCRAVDDFRHVADLLRLRLEGIRRQSPLIGVRFEAEDVKPWESSPQELFAVGQQQELRRFEMLLNHLAGRLGDDAVVRPQLLPDAVPERAVAFVPVTHRAASGPSPSPETLRPLDRPTRLYAEPRPVEVLAAVPDGPPAALFYDGRRFDIVSQWGPERMDSGWWQGPAVRRDYYRVATSDGRRLWLFRRLQDRRWFWHGEAL